MNLENEISQVLQGLDIHNVDELLQRTAEIRRLILTGDFPDDMRTEILTCYHELSQQYGVRPTDGAVVGNG